MKNLGWLFLALGVAVLSVSCTGGGPRLFGAPTVNAAGFSNASLSGGFGFADSGETFGTAGIKFAETGVLTFDGAGSFRGTATMNNGGMSCTAIVTGTYSINPDGSGSAMVTQTPDAASSARGCTMVTFPAALGLSAGGAQIQFVELSTLEILSGLALKQ
jgi:hypothetical protein